MATSQRGNRVVEYGFKYGYATVGVGSPMNIPFNALYFPGCIHHVVVTGGASPGLWITGNISGNTYMQTAGMPKGTYHFDFIYNESLAFEGNHGSFTFAYTGNNAQ